MKNSPEFGGVKSLTWVCTKVGASHEQTAIPPSACWSSLADGEINGKRGPTFQNVLRQPHASNNFTWLSLALVYQVT